MSFFYRVILIRQTQILGSWLSFLIQVIYKRYETYSTRLRFDEADHYLGLSDEPKRVGFSILSFTWWR
jgi:hypothetical protein